MDSSFLDYAELIVLLVFAGGAVVAHFVARWRGEHYLGAQQPTTVPIPEEQSILHARGAALLCGRIVERELLRAPLSGAETVAWSLELRATKPRLSASLWLGQCASLTLEDGSGARALVQGGPALQWAKQWQSCCYPLQLPNPALEELFRRRGLDLARACIDASFEVHEHRLPKDLGQVWVAGEVSHAGVDPQHSRDYRDAGYTVNLRGSGHAPLLICPDVDPRDVQAQLAAQRSDVLFDQLTTVGPAQGISSTPL
jgi:hypothetical protein